jgi:hypothetical protein
VGLHVYQESQPALEEAGSRRTVQRWLHRLLPDAAQVQGALRTAVIERSEPQPVERLFPGGVSPPVAIRCRRWKDPEAVYRLATGLVFLVEGAVARSISATVLLAAGPSRPALRRPPGPGCAVSAPCRPGRSLARAQRLRDAWGVLKRLDGPLGLARR